MATLLDLVEKTAAEGLVDRRTWDALPALLKVARAIANLKGELQEAEIHGDEVLPSERAAIEALEPLLREVEG